MSAFNVGLKASGLGLAVTDGEALAFICPYTKLRSYLVQCYDGRTKNRVFKPLMVVQRFFWSQASPFVALAVHETDTRFLAIFSSLEIFAFWSRGIHLTCVSDGRLRRIMHNAMHHGVIKSLLTIHRLPRTLLISSEEHFTTSLFFIVDLELQSCLQLWFIHGNRCDSTLADQHWPTNTGRGPDKRHPGQSAEALAQRDI